MGRRRRHKSCTAVTATMNTAATTLLVLVAGLALAHCARIARDDKYTTKYDNIDLDEILSSDRLLNNYFKCLVSDTDKGCTTDGKLLRETVPDALTNECSKCSETQKNGAKKVIKHLIEKKPDLWKQLETKYDPSGSYQKKYDSELKKVTA